MSRKKSDVTILVVEDEKTFRDLVVELLKRCGFKVRDAVGGKAALEILKKERVDLILSDIRMPEGDGHFLLDEIRRIDPNIPVLVFLTGFGEESVRKCIERGAFHVLSKPCSRSALLGVIDQALASTDTAKVP